MVLPSEIVTDPAKLLTVVDNLTHVGFVRKMLNHVARQLLVRGEVHDESKFASPELETFAEYTPKLKTTTFGSPDYQACLDGMKEALRHHYAANSHHPEHFPHGVTQMSLLDLTEMLCDWYAASLRHDDGNIYKSLLFCHKRFKFSPSLGMQMLHTMDTLEAVADTGHRRSPYYQLCWDFFATLNGITTDHGTPSPVPAKLLLDTAAVGTEIVVGGTVLRLAGRDESGRPRLELPQLAVEIALSGWSDFLANPAFDLTAVKRRIDSQEKEDRNVQENKQAGASENGG